MDPVYPSAAEAALRAEGFTPIVLDAAISAAEGSILAFPRRLMIETADFEAAAAFLDAWEASL